MFFSAEKRITYVSQAVHFTSIERQQLAKTTVQMLASLRNKYIKPFKYIFVQIQGGHYIFRIICSLSLLKLVIMRKSHLSLTGTWFRIFLNKNVGYSLLEMYLNLQLDDEVRSRSRGKILSQHSYLSAMEALTA